MNRKGLDTGIIIFFVIVVILLVLAYVFVIKKQGIFSTMEKPVVDEPAFSQVQDTCLQACSNKDMQTYCCSEFMASGQKYKCTDSRLEIPCGPLYCGDNKC